MGLPLLIELESIQAFLIFSTQNSFFFSHFVLNFEKEIKINSTSESPLPQIQQNASPPSKGIIVKSSRPFFFPRSSCKWDMQSITFYYEQGKI